MDVLLSCCHASRGMTLVPIFWRQPLQTIIFAAIMIDTVMCYDVVNLLPLCINMQ